MWSPKTIPNLRLFDVVGQEIWHESTQLFPLPNFFNADSSLLMSPFIPIPQQQTSDRALTKELVELKRSCDLLQKQMTFMFQGWGNHKSLII
jgi:hypothetical protein